MKIYTRTGDDGTTGLLYGGRIAKTSPQIGATGAVDEAQAALGVARAETERGSSLDELLVKLERGLYLAMAELTTAPENRAKLVPGRSAVSQEMVDDLERHIDDACAGLPEIRDFVVPGATRSSAALDLARAVIRRAERDVLGVCPPESLVPAYLNRLSDLAWALARSEEGTERTLSPSRKSRPASG
ncbi:MAG: cob(I)yrinic acid a,c-diamide adenosyltransferase [Acidimicrobiales bacterium]